MRKFMTEELLRIAGAAEEFVHPEPSAEAVAEVLERRANKSLAGRVRRLSDDAHRLMMWCASHASIAYDIGLELGLHMASEDDGEVVPTSAVCHGPAGAGGDCQSTQPGAGSGVSAE